MPNEKFKKHSFPNTRLTSNSVASRLYSITPLYVENSLVESLTSYISRLALAHCVYPGILMEREVKQAIGKKHSSANLHNLYSFTGAINGFGTMGLDIVNALEQLTLQKQLSSLTLINLSELTTSRNLLHKYRKWCPQCFASWKAKNQELYEPLLWKLKVIEICSVHNSLLQEKCPHCNLQNYHLAWKTRPGYCSKCDLWLGKTEKYNIAQNIDLNWYSWVNKNIDELLLKD